MAILTPLIGSVTPQVQPHTLEIETERTTSSKEEYSQLLDTFLKSCTETASTHVAPTNTIPSNTFQSAILILPLDVVKKIIRNLLISPSPLILQHDFITTPKGYRTYVEPNVLQVCKLFHNTGLPILYGENTITASSPATSFDFDDLLLSLPGSKRQMISDVKLEIDWADQLWAKFPLVARALGELKGLLKLEIVIVKKETMVEKKRTSSIANDANLKIMITYGQHAYNEERSANRHAPATDRADCRVKREGPVADVMLKAEMKMFKDLVTGIKGLKQFRLIGFKNEVFAWCLEEHVRIGNR